jgi:hypothetical protein
MCSKCFHEEVNHQSGSICNGSLTCLCQKFETPFLNLFAQMVEKEKFERKTIFKRCEYILEKLPQTRNAGEKTFAKIYWEIWHGLKIRAKSITSLNKSVWDRLPNQDTINREKRRCKQWNEELKTYSPEVIMQQTAIYQALMEMSIEN